MKNSRVFLMLVLLTLSSCRGDSQCELRLKNLQEIRDNGWVVIDPGYLKGSEYLQLDAQRQQYYVDGVIDGMRLAPYFGAYDQTYPESKLNTLIYCVRSLGDERKSKVDKHFLAHPEKMKDSAHGLIYIALREACNGMIENCKDTTCQGFARM